MIPFVDAVRAWHDLYTVVGSVSGTLIGLLFVAASVGARIYTRERLPAVRAFVSPSVVHFSAVLAVCLVSLVPTSSWTLAGLMVGAVGSFGLVYAGLVWRGMHRHGFHANLDLEDRVWYAAVPAAGHATVAVAAVLLLCRSEAGCGVLALAMGLLLLGGIRNAWDITVFAVTRE